MYKLLIVIAVIQITLFQCKKNSNNSCTNPDDLIIGLDLSTFPEIRQDNGTYFNESNQEIDILTELKNKGVNTIRLKLWNNPIDEHASLDEVLSFSCELKEKGYKIWLDFHYSDSWADPGNQVIPSSWNLCDYPTLIDSIYDYTLSVVTKVNPDYVQIGNEINNGFLHPFGQLNQPEQFTTLLDTACKAVRSFNNEIKIIMHYAGYNGAEAFYNSLSPVDYDFIGLSYYPKWHGKSLDSLSLVMNNLHQNTGKDVLIAETAYPFTLSWNDQTHNVIGSDDHLILPNFPATPEGQFNFMEEIKQLSCYNVTGGIGFCYWGGEMIAWKGNNALDGSSWENLALFDFDHKALPVLDVFCLN